MKDPSRPFIHDSDGAVYTYGDINRVSNMVANYLIKVGGIGEGDVAMIVAHRSSPLVSAILAVLKTGATASIIDPAYPAARQINYVEVAKPKAIIMLEGIELPPEMTAHIMEMQIEEYACRRGMPQLTCLLTGVHNRPEGIAAISDYNDRNTQQDTAVDDTAPAGVPAITPDNIAMMSFTSGTSGVPKAVKGRHISLTHFYPWMAEEFHLSAEDNFTMLSGIAHDPLQRDVFTPIFFGATLKIPTEEDILEPGRLARWCAANSITITHLTPAMGQLLTADATDMIPSLRHAFFVGDVLTKRDVTRLQQLAENVKIVNMYGTTETQRAVSYLTIPNDPFRMQKRKEIIAAGRGMQGVQLLVLNSRMQQCGIGEVGEIYVRSHHLAAGYLGLARETEEKFLKNPFTTRGTGGTPTSEEDQDHGMDDQYYDRIYRTGDVGRYTVIEGGKLCIVECVGRADDQVKIRGFRVELREVDTFLSQHSSVREVVTLLRRDVNEEHRLVSYFVPMVKGEIIPFSMLREHLRQKLPAYAIPTDFVPLKRMPLCPNGKVDKAKLPFPDTFEARVRKLTSADTAAADTATAAPSVVLTPIQQVLHDIWSSLLQKPHLSISDNFFEAGGHSILATRALFAMRQRLPDCSVHFNAIYQFPTIDALADVLETANDDLASLNVAALMFPGPTPPPTTSAQFPEVGGCRRKVVDLFAEATLDESISIHSPALLPAHRGKPFTFNHEHINPRHIFLTGATGFLGAFLLADLLSQYPTATVHCLVRDGGRGVESSSSSAVDLAHRRIMDTLDAHHLLHRPTDAAARGRVVAVVGDLALPRYGLSVADFNKLAESIEIIVHNGALVHWVYPYPQLKGPNVDGTRTALELATTHHLKPLYFLSSTSVFDCEYYLNLSNKKRLAGSEQQRLCITGAVAEDDTLDPSGDSDNGLTVGYGQSKWVAEKILQTASRERHLPVAIIRPGYIVGHSQSGIGNSDDFLWRLIKGCIQTGRCPRMRNRLNMCPVDYVSHLTLSVIQEGPASLGKAYHALNRTLFRYEDFFQHIIDFGYNVQMVPYIEWKDALQEFTLRTQTEPTVNRTLLDQMEVNGDEEDAERNALFPLLHFVLDDLPTRARFPHLDDSNAYQVADRHYLRCPSMQSVIGKYFAFFVAAGFFPPPPRAGEAGVTALPVIDTEVITKQIKRTGN